MEAKVVIFDVLITEVCAWEALGDVFDGKVHEFESTLSVKLDLNSKNSRALVPKNFPFREISKENIFFSKNFPLNKN